MYLIRYATYDFYLENAKILHKIQNLSGFGWILQNGWIVRFSQNLRQKLVYTLLDAPYDFNLAISAKIDEFWDLPKNLRQRFTCTLLDAHQITLIWK